MEVVVTIVADIEWKQKNRVERMLTDDYKRVSPPWKGRLSKRGGSNRRNDIESDGQRPPQMCQQDATAQRMFNWDYKMLSKYAHTTKALDH